MGRLFLQHLGGSRVYTCEHCDTFLTNRQELMSKSFTGTTGTAFLFNRVVNLIYSEVHDRAMLSGRHFVRDVSCKKCGTKLGWMYEFAKPVAQKFKEGKVILEQALIRETLTFQELPAIDAGATSGSSNASSPTSSVGAGGPAVGHGHHYHHHWVHNLPHHAVHHLHHAVHDQEI